MAQKFLTCCISWLSAICLRQLLLVVLRELLRLLLLLALLLHQLTGVRAITPHLLLLVDRQLQRIIKHAEQLLFLWAPTCSSKASAAAALQP